MKYLIFGLLILIGCNGSFPGESALDKVGGIAKKRLKTDYHLFAYGFGCSWPKKCEAISFALNYNSNVTISQARELTIHALQAIVDSTYEVNEFEKYLAEPPFTVKHVMMTITFDHLT